MNLERIANELREKGSNPFPVPGCAYLTSANYAAFATEDDGSCISPGCMDTVALNDSPHFNVSRGKCIYPPDAICWRYSRISGRIVKTEMMFEANACLY